MRRNLTIMSKPMLVQVINQNYRQIHCAWTSIQYSIIKQYCTLSYWSLIRFLCSCIWLPRPLCMVQISIKTPNPKFPLFLKICQYLAAGVYLSEAPDPLPPPPLHTVWIHVLLYLFTQGKKEGVGVDEPVRRLEDC
jgi:hypothetical protein